MRKKNYIMSNKKIQQLSDAQIVKNSTINLDIPYVFQDGDGNIMNYSLISSDKIPLTFSCKFSTSKLRNGIPCGEEIENNPLVRGLEGFVEENLLLQRLQTVKNDLSLLNNYYSHLRNILNR